MNITGMFYNSNYLQRTSSGTKGTATGAFSYTNSGGTGGQNWGANGGECNFNASKTWTGATSSNGAHKHTLTTSTLTNSGLFGLSDTVQPDAIKLRVKTRFI